MKHRSIWNKLTKSELVHVIETCLVRDAIEEFKKTRSYQISKDKKGFTCCWDCKLIAKKLGIE